MIYLLQIKKILQRGIDAEEANAILVKVNQIGTLSETFDTMDLAYKNDFIAIISHRSGETGDHFISDSPLPQVLDISRQVLHQGLIEWKNTTNSYELKRSLGLKQFIIQLNSCFYLRSNEKIWTSYFMTF